MSADIVTADQEPEVVLDTTKETPNTKTPKLEIPQRPQSDSDKPEDDGIIRVSNKDGKMRASIGYLMSRLNDGHQATL